MKKIREFECKSCGVTRYSGVDQNDLERMESSGVPYGKPMPCYCTTLFGEPRYTWHEMVEK